MLIVLVMHSLLTLSSHAFRAGKPRVNRLMISRLLSNLEVKLGDVPLSASSSTSSTADIQSGSRDDYLFGNQSITFADLGVLPSLSAALTKLDKPFATTIQAATFDFILSGKDTVIAAETGSGKTLSYLIPILHLLLEDNYRENVHYPSAVIVVPNKELSFQVLRMANEILERVEPDQRTISIAAATSATGYWPYRVEESPNVLVCTPAFVGKFLRGPNILDEDLFRSIRHFVLDEADMLLEGSYLTDIEKILDAFKLVRRQMIRDGQIQVHSNILQYILSAATLPSYGLRSMEKYIESRFPKAKWISNEHLHKHHPRIVQSFHRVQGREFMTPERIKLVMRAIFNQPLEGEGAEELSVAFLDSIPLEQPDDMLQPEDSTMVFVNTAEVAMDLAGALRRKNIACAEFHKLQMASDKQEGLQSFRDQVVKVLVCTDHAARGLDLPHVKHVIQAEFALNVVQHLHRVGRASRAGALGRATNIVDDRSSELVRSILSEAETKSVDQSFSRRRGFRNKIKKAIKRSRESEGYESIGEPEGQALLEEENEGNYLI